MVKMHHNLNLKKNLRIALESLLLISIPANPEGLKRLRKSTPKGYLRNIDLEGVSKKAQIDNNICIIIQNIMYISKKATFFNIMNFWTRVSQVNLNPENTGQRPLRTRFNITRVSQVNLTGRPGIHHMNIVNRPETHQKIRQAFRFAQQGA